MKNSEKAVVDIPRGKVKKETSGNAKINHSLTPTESKKRILELETRLKNLEMLYKQRDANCQLNEVLLASMNYPAMYIRRKDRVIIAVNKVAADMGVKVGGYCWREFMKEEHLSKKDVEKIKKHPKNFNNKDIVKCVFCLGDKCFTENTEQNLPEIEIFGRFWNTYWIKVSDEAYLHYAIDITAKKNAREQLQLRNEQLIKANADKDRFMSILAHDLIAPFNSIIGFSELLAENLHAWDPEKTESMLHQINGSAKQTFSLLKDLLDWSRSNSGNLIFEPTILNLKNICCLVIENLASHARSKNITLHQLNTEGINFMADKFMLSTILRNLISNAIKFTHRGGRVIISATKTNKIVEVTVSDNGIGIPPDVQAGLFDFTKITTTKGTAQEGGSGLGLLLCNEFVVKHGGTIHAASKPGEGSQFIFTIPLSGTN